MVTKVIFLHNKRITSSKMSEDKDQERYKNKSQGRCISHMEMLHVMLKYPKIVNNLDFIKVSTIP